MEARMPWFAFLMIVLVSVAQGQLPDTIKSPDGRRIAVIRDIKAVPPWGGTESVIKILGKTGKVIFYNDYTEDGSLGHRVNPIGWTANSQFFLYTLESSGGHQFWHYNVQVYSTRMGEVVNLDDYFVYPITVDAQVSLGSPDSVFVTVDTSAHVVEWREQSYRVSLSKLLSNKNPKIK
jgi:hypothetical protein